MTSPPAPPGGDDSARLSTLESYRILDSEPEPAFDDLVRLCSRVLGVPMAAISLMDGKRQWFKARVGLELPETSQNDSLCRHILEDAQTLVVPDTLQDERFNQHPMVCGPPRIRFYASTPLVVGDGHILGTLCALDVVPRKLSDEQRWILEVMAREVVAQIELRRWRQDPSIHLDRLREAAYGTSGSIPQAPSENFRVLESVLESLPVGVWIADSMGRIVLGNSAGDRILGSPSRAEDTPPAGASNPRRNSAPRLRALEGTLHRALRRGDTEQSEVLEMEASDGTTRTLSSSSAPIRDASRRIVGAVIVTEDITERRRAEELTRRSVSLLRATLESTADGILVVDNSGGIVDFNRRFAEMWAIPDPVLASRNDDQALAFVLEQLTEPERFLAKVRELYARPDAESFDILEFKDGRAFERYSRPQRLGESWVGRVWSFRDVTRARRAAEELQSSREQLFQSQKMEAVGRLAGGVAHDFNNLLTAITGYSDLLLRRLPSADPMRTELEEIKKAGQRAAALTRQLLAFSRKQLLKPSVLDMNVVVIEVDKMLRRLIGEDIELSARLRPELGRVKADQGQLEQVIVNLAVNARDAMPQGGELRLETTEVDVPSPGIRGLPGIPAGRYVILSMTDTGMGMDEATLAHLFEPFFTTKAKGKGTGLGLSTAYGIIRQSGGYIRVESRVGEGSTFRIYLPRTEEAEHPCPSGGGQAGLEGGSETVLVVEDEDSVRRLVSTILTQKGYRVLEACDGPTALEVCAKRGLPIHLMLTDVVMPKMNGKELAERVKQSRRDLKVLFMSGYTENTVVHGGTLDPGTVLISKPFSPETLALRVREALDRPPDRLRRG